MIDRVNDYFICAKQDTEAASDRDGQGNNSASSGVKLTAVWQSPEFKEFDLCMEVTAYVQQWD